MNFGRDLKLNTNDILKVNDVKKILKSSGNAEYNCVKKCAIYSASDKMLGFLAEYWKLKIELITNGNETKTVQYFIKAVSRSNKAKAHMVNEMKLFEKEIFFYTIITGKLKIPGIKPWSAKLVESFDDTMVFEDLNALQYTMNNKLQTFDENHTVLALQALAAFHASSIIYEEIRSKQLGRAYRINEEYVDHLDSGGYDMSSKWYTQCMVGALEAVKTYSKYSNDKYIMSIIENHWKSVWENALNLSSFSSKYRNVICHRDLWNNNILFKYNKRGDNSVPIDCVFVDFQAVKCQPLAGDVMLLLYCNLESQFRDKNMNKFLNYYFNELKNILDIKGVNIDNILSLEDYLMCCNEQRLWGLVVSACLVPQIWIDDELTTVTFSDTEKFQQILTKDKATFIKTMIETDESYKVKVLQIFDEIVERYCLDK